MPPYNTIPTASPAAPNRPSSSAAIGTAEDGSEFGFELAAPLKHGDTFFQSATARYSVQQHPESVVAVSLDVTPSAAAGIGWAVGIFSHVHSQEMLKVFTSPHLAALSPSVCVGVSRSLHIARAFLLELVHVNEKAQLPTFSLPFSLFIFLTFFKAEIRSRCSRGLSVLLLRPFASAP